MRHRGETAQAPPAAPRPTYAGAEVTSEPGVGFLLVSRITSRRYFCPEDGHLFPTHFEGSVRKAFECFLHADLEEDDHMSSFVFDGKLWKYRPSRPLALKTSRIDALKLEARWQRCPLGELVGEDPIKEVSTLQLLHNDKEGGPGGHAGVEELVEALVDSTNLYKISVWYDGGELFERCPMPERDAKGVFAQILDALKFVHNQGVCHRDISLENILMDTSSSSSAYSKRSCSSRSCSVSSIGSCISVASSSDDYNEGNDAGEDDSAGGGAGAGSSSCGSCGGFQSGDDGCCLNRSSGDGGCGCGCGQSSGSGVDIGTAERRQAAAAAAADAGEEWIGTPRLCDFGMSVRIPTTETGAKAPVTPQGRCGKSTCVAPEIFYDQVFDAHAIDTWSVGTTLFMALLGVQPWEEIGDFKFQAIAEGKNLDVVLEGWKLRHVISDEALDLLQAMLTADPEERLSDIESILAHPWFSHTPSSSSTAAKTTTGE